MFEKVFRNGTFFFLILISLFALPGCGKAKGSVKGTVTYKGKNLTSGTVNIRGSDKLVQQSVINENGEYFVQNLAVGPAEVSILAEKPGREELMKKLSGRGKVNTGQPVAIPANMDEYFSLIPIKYNEFENSGLVIEVKSGENKHDLNLEK